MRRFVAASMGLMMVFLAVFASAQETGPTLDISGVLTYGFVSNSDTSPHYSDALDDATIDFTGTTDEYNQYRIRLEYYGGTDDLQEAGEDMEVDEAFITTDLGAFFGLDTYGVSLAWRNGFDDVNGAVYSAGTRYAFDEITDNDDLSTDDDWFTEVKFGFLDEMIALKSAVLWDNGQGADDIPDMLFEIDSQPVAGVSLAVTYSTNRTAGGAVGATSSVDLGQFVSSLSTSGFGIGIGASVATNLSDTDDYADSLMEPDSIAPEQVAWGASVKATYLGGDLGVSYHGAAEDEDNGAFGYAIVGVDAGYQVLPLLGVYGGVALDFTDYEAVDATAENIDGVSGGEVGASLDIGALNIKSGYWFSDGYGEGSIDALGDNPDGGMFFRFSYSWG